MPDHGRTLPPSLPPALHEPVRLAESELRRVMGRLAGQVEFRWGWDGAASPPVVTLTLTVGGSSRSAELYDFEFAEPMHVRRRVRQVWSELLSDRFDQLWQASEAVLTTAAGA